MSLSGKETEELKVRGWKRRAKGHPTRWRMLRDAVAVLSLKWMDTSDFQIAMRRIWALKNNTARDMLEELEQGGDVSQEKDPKSGTYKWGATRSGVRFWIVKVDRIPAGIVEVVGPTPFVPKSEELIVE